MKTIRIKPGREVKTRKELKIWYKIILKYIPYGFKDRPWCIVNKSKLPEIFKALSEENFI